jgi:thioredoxin-dependent peroxiredoxin
MRKSVTNQEKTGLSDQPVEERKGVVTFKGQPITLVGSKLTAGQRAPDFKLVDIQEKIVSSAESKGKIRLISTVYSLNEPICDLQTQIFEQEAVRIPSLVIYTISLDSPSTQAQYCEDHKVINSKTLSDCRDASFGISYGVLIKEFHLLARAVFIVDADDIVRYVEYVKEVTGNPDFENALRILEVIYGENTRD